MITTISLLALFAWCAPSVVAQSTAAPIVEDWTRLVPGDVRFYVEMNDLADVRRQFRKLGIWNTLVEIREQDGQQTQRTPWQLRTRELLGLDAEEVITELLGRRSALLASTPAEWDNGILLAELGNSQILERLLKDGNAREMTPEGPVRRYQFGGGLTLAVAGQMIAIGPAGDPDGLWSRTAQLMAGQRGPSLGSRADFAALRSRLAPEPQGVLYTVWDRDDPTAVAGCRRMLIGVWLKPDEIICAIHGQRAERQDDAPAVDVSAIDAMPATTLAAWVGSIDLPSLHDDRSRRSPVEYASIAHVFLSVFGHLRMGDQSLLESIGPNCRLIIGRDPPALATGFDLPGLTISFDVRSGDQFIATLDTVFDILAKSLAVMTSNGDLTIVDKVRVRKTPCEDVVIHSVEVGPYLARRVGIHFLRKLEPCWVMLDGRLVLSSSKGHVEEIVRALRGKGPRLSQTSLAMQLAAVTEGQEPVAEFLLFRGQALSAMLTNWLSYFAEHHPYVLKGDWWKSWAQGQVAERLRLGIGLETDKQAPNRAVVVEISEVSPAMNYLVPDDVIVAAGGHPLVSDRPAHEVAERYRNRGSAEFFELQILRDGSKMSFQIPVQPAAKYDLDQFDPPRAIRQLAALVRRIDSVIFCRYRTKPDRLDARIVIQWDSPRR